MLDAKAPDVELLLATVTYTHPGTLRLKEIQYRVDVLRQNRKTPLFEAAIMVENKKVSPKVTTSATLPTPRARWEQFLK